MNSALADAVVLLHLSFILFAVGGAALLFIWPKLVWLHLPCLAWGIWIEFSGGICPLTPLENHYRALAGQEGYGGGFIDHYIMPVIYPEGLTSETQFLLGGGLIAINLGVYGLWRWRGRQRGVAWPSSSTR